MLGATFPALKYFSDCLYRTRHLFLKRVNCGVGTWRASLYWYRQTQALSAGLSHAKMSSSDAESMQWLWYHVSVVPAQKTVACSLSVASAQTSVPLLDCSQLEIQGKKLVSGCPGVNMTYCRLRKSLYLASEILNHLSSLSYLLSWRIYQTL